MTQPMKDMFERLLKACEALTRSEAAALKDRDFSRFTQLRDTKDAILMDMQGCANAPVQEPAIRVRLERLMEMNIAGGQMLAEMKAETGERLRQVRAAMRKLRTLRPALPLGGYEEKEGFEAHG